MEGFVAMMNQRAKSLGLQHSKFVNPDGLPDPPGQLMSALDLAKLSRHIINSYLQYYRYFSERSYTVKVSESGKRWYSARPAYSVLVTGTPSGVFWIPSAAASIFLASKVPTATPATSAPCIE